jgi:outer membrane protein TolC
MKKSVIITMLLSVLVLLYPAEVEHLSYSRAISIALKENLKIKMARNSALIARRNAHVGNAGLLPKMELSGETSYQEGISSTSTQLLASYTLFNGLANVLTWKKLQSGKRSGNLEARNQIEQILLEVSTAYYSAASAYEQLLIAQELLKISRERLERAEKRSLYGRATTIDVLSAQVDFASDQVTLNQSRFLWQESCRNLNVLLNRDVNCRFQVETEVNFASGFSLENLLAKALERNASYLTALEYLRQLRLDVRISASVFYPRLDITGSYGLSQSSDGWKINLNDPIENSRIGLNLKLNIFDGLKNLVQQKIAKIEYHNQELTVSDQRLILEKQVINSHEAYKNKLLELELEKQYVDAAELNFRRTQELYNLGQVTTTQFREAQINLIRSRSNVATAKYDAKLKEIMLLQLTGQLTPVQPVR